MHKTKRHLLKIVPILSGLALILVLAGSVFMLLRSPDDKSDTEEKPATVADDDKKTAKKASVTLDASAGTNYSWNYEISDSSIAKHDSTVTIDVDPDMDGGQLKNKFIFEGLKEGETRVYFNYKENTDDGDISDSAEYIIYVDKDLNARVEKVEILDDITE